MVNIPPPDFDSLRERPGDPGAHQRESAPHVCAWTHPATSSLPDHKVELIGNTAWVRVGPGFDVAAGFAALLRELRPGGDPAKRDDWDASLYTEFRGWPAETVREHLRLGLEPVFERYRADPRFQAELLVKAPKFAARYELWIQAAAAPGPLTGSKAEARRL